MDAPKKASFFYCIFNDALYSKNVGVVTVK